MYFAILYVANYFVQTIRSQGSLYDVLAAAIVSIAVLQGARVGKYAFVALVGLALLAMIFQARYRRPMPALHWILTTLVLVSAFGATAWVRGVRLAVGNSQPREWLEVQRWARQNTAREDILEDIFIVPPNLMGFRVESERGIYADWKDGTQTFFNPRYGLEWIRRMKALGLPDLEKMGGRVRVTNFWPPPSELCQRSVSAQLPGSWRRPQARRFW